MRSKLSTLWLAGLLSIAALAAGCAGEHRAARDKYNEGVAALAKGEYEPAEKALLEARNLAGVDPELALRRAIRSLIAVVVRRCDAAAARRCRCQDEPRDRARARPGDQR